MPAPDVAEEPDVSDDSDVSDVPDVSDNSDASEDTPEETEPDTEEDPDVEEVEVGEDDFDPNSLFSGSETAEDSSSDSGSGSSSPSPDPSGAGSLDSGALGDAVTDGMARLAVVNWPDDADQSADEMEDEFSEVFEAFQMDVFAEQSAEEYLFADAGEIDPLWGLCGSMVMACAFVLIMRPDGEEKMSEIAEKIGGSF